MLNDKNLRLSLGYDGECLICDEKLEYREVAIQVEFDVPAVVTTIHVKRVMHILCAKKLNKMLEDRIRDSGV